MGHRYCEIAFTPSVNAQQTLRHSREHYARLQETADPRDRLGGGRKSLLALLAGAVAPTLCREKREAVKLLQKRRRDVGLWGLLPVSVHRGPRCRFDRESGCLPRDHTRLRQWLSKILPRGARSPLTKEGGGISRPVTMWTNLLSLI